MIQRLLLLMFAFGAVAALVSCSTQEQAKTPGPPTGPNFNSSPTPEERPIGTATDLAWMIEDRKEMKRAWANFERSQKYRLAQAGEIRHSPFMIWSEAEAYQGDQLLLVIVVDPSRSDRNRYGLVVIGAPSCHPRSQDR